MEETSGMPGASDDRAVRLAVVAAVASVLLVAAAVVAHATQGPAVVWVLAALAALSARPVAVLVHRRHPRPEVDAPEP